MRKLEVLEYIFKNAGEVVRNKRDEVQLKYENGNYYFRVEEVANNWLKVTEETALRYANYGTWKPHKNNMKHAHIGE